MRNSNYFRPLFRVLFFALFVAVSNAAFSNVAVSADTDSREAARKALHRAVAYFQQEVSIEGGYLWRYSADLKEREGETVASATTAWVQPPGTPTVGDALLSAYQRTREAKLLEAARQTAHALVNGQLESGGWDYRIEFDPENRKRYRYRSDPDRPSARNTTTLDDNTTQAALSFLLRIDRELEFEDDRIHGTVEYALQKLLAAQYPNGAWPQRFDQSPDPNKFPVLRANYPDEWSRTYVKLDYRSYYTFNDNSIADMIETMFLATAVTQDQKYQQAARRAGDFILLAQMPEPQPAWAQQYNAKMQPAWARKFEPPAVTGGESQGIIRVLLSLYRQTGDRKYLEPIPRALDYLERSQISDGMLARFFELKTNRPLYFTMQYELTYSDDDLPTHYGFQVGARIDRLRRDFDRASREQVPLATPVERTVRLTSTLSDAANQLVENLDDRGAWIEEGRLRSRSESTRIINVSTFVRNVEILSRYLSAE